MQRVMSVDSASAIILKSNPPQVGIAAVGKVPTTGWTRPLLEPWFYIVPPADGVQDFDSVADPPTHIVLPMVSPIATHAVITRNPNEYWGKGKPLTGVRIHARENSVVAKLEATGAFEAHLVSEAIPESGAPYPWPWPWLVPGVHVSGDEDPFPLRARAAFGGSDVPFPLGMNNYCLSQLIGKTVRVFHTGDVITMDFRADRLNLDLNPTTQRIVRAFFG